MRPPLIPPETQTWTMSDRYALRGRYWPGRAGAEVGVLYLHGIQSHGGWFEWSASVLAKQGLPVVLPDRRGSGMNTAGRGDVVHWRRWLDDVAELWAWLQEAAGVKRVAVVGVSWGGKLAAACTQDARFALERLLLVAPGLFPAVDVGWMQRLRIGLSSAAAPRKRFPIPLSDPSLFTDNPAGREFIAADPHKLSEATARFFLMSTLLDRRLRRMSSGSITTKGQLVLAECDRIIDNAATQDWAVRAAPGLAVDEFPGAAHTLEFAREVGGYEALLQRWAKACV